MSPLRPDEEQRLRSVRSLDLLDTEVEAEFQELAQAAALVCEVPIALIALVDEDRQWIKANIGWSEVQEIPREVSFCARAILHAEPLELTDAAQDPLFKDNPLVTHGPGIRFYAGFPLRLSDGSAIGTLCVIDRRPRQLTDPQRLVMQHLACSIASAMESRRARREADIRAAVEDALHSRWGHVFENLHDGFILGEAVRDAHGTARDWRYIDVNAAWSRMVSVPQASARGRTIREVFPGIEESWVLEGIEILGRQEPAYFERQVGSLGRWYKGQATWLGGDRFVISFTEITESLLVQLRQQAMLELTDRLGRSDAPEEELLKGAFEVIGRLTDASMVGYGEVEADGQSLTIKVEWAPEAKVSRLGVHWLPDYGSAILPALWAGRTYWVDDVRKDQAVFGDQCNAVGVQSFLNVPIIEDGELQAVYFVSPRSQPEREPWPCRIH